MKQYKSCSELKDIAREKLSGKYGSAMLVSPVLPYLSRLITLFPLYMIILMPLMVNMIVNNSEMDMTSMVAVIIVLCIITIICNIFLGVLNAGVTLFFLNIACRKRYTFSDLFFGYRWQFKKSLAFSAITILLSNLCLLPYQIFATLIQFDMQLKWAIGALISYIIGMAVYLPIQLSISQYLYLLLDFPRYSVKELLKLSMRVTKGHKRRLFYIQLSFIPLELLCLCSFYIGYLWLYPYMNMTYTLFFLDLMNPKQTVEQHFDQYV